MRDQRKTKAQLIAEVKALRAQLADLEEEKSRPVVSVVESGGSPAGPLWDQAPVLAAVKDPEGRYVYANLGYQVAFGFERDWLIGRRDEEAFSAESAAAIRSGDDHVLKTSSPAQYWETLESEATRRHFLTVRFPVFGPAGLVAGLGSLAVEVTAEYEAHQDLVASESRCRGYVERLDLGLGRVDENGRVVDVNDRLCRLLGCNRGEVIGRPAADFLSGPNQQTWARERLRRWEGWSTPYRIELTAKDGRRVPVLAAPSPWFDRQGRFFGSVFALIDLSRLDPADLGEAEKKV